MSIKKGSAENLFVDILQALISTNSCEQKNDEYDNIHANARR